MTQKQMDRYFNLIGLSVVGIAIAALITFFLYSMGYADKSLFQIMMAGTLAVSIIGLFLFMIVLGICVIQNYNRG